MNAVLHPRRLVLRLVVIAAAVSAALVVLPGATAHAEPAPCTRTFSSGTLNERIPDQGVVASDIDVPENGLLVADVDWTLNIRHPRPADLEARAISYPDGLGRQRGFSFLFVTGNAAGPGADMLGTTFDDDAPAAITSGSAPFTGRFEPVGQLSTMIGFAGGEYRLVLFDDVAGNEGTLVSWSVTLTFADCDADGDGVLTFTDSCPSVAGRSPSGCPTAARSLAASYRKGQFRGALSSPVGECKVGRAVSVFKVRSGPDRKIGTTTTRADGSWRLSRAKKRGRYYATSVPLFVPRVAECPTVRSRTFRVR